VPIRGLADAPGGRRDEKTRGVIGCYAGEIRIYPEDKTSEMVLNAAVFPFLEGSSKENVRSEERSCVDMVTGTCYEAIQRMPAC
jgi:hypothetical protein